MRSFGLERKKSGSIGLALFCSWVAFVLVLGLAGMFWAIFGPSPPPLTEADVSTTYIVVADWGTARLILHRNHTFDQVVTRKDHTEAQITGTWKMKLTDYSEGVSGIVSFSPILDVTHDQQGVLASLGVPSIARLSSGKIEIAADPDYGIDYESR